MRRKKQEPMEAYFDELTIQDRAKHDVWRIAYFSGEVKVAYRAV